MTGIKILVVIFGIVSLQAIITNAEENLLAKVSKLESNMQSLQQEHAQRQESFIQSLHQLTKRIVQEEEKGLRLQAELETLKQQLQNYLPERKKDHILDAFGKLHQQDSPSALLPKKRHSRSFDPDEVAFTAELSHELNNVPLDTVIRFGDLIYSTDQSYDNTTGVFTCPTSGLYLFAVFIESNSVGKEAVVHLYKDGTAYMNVVSERGGGDGEDDTGGNVVLLPVNKGQRVWVETYQNDNQAFWPWFTTFSGVLIHRN